MDSKEPRIKSEPVDIPPYGSVLVRPLNFGNEIQLERLLLNGDPSDRKVVEVLISLCCFSHGSEGTDKAVPLTLEQAAALTDEELNGFAKVLLQKLPLDIKDFKRTEERSTSVETLATTVRARTQYIKNLFKADFLSQFKEGLKGFTPPKMDWVSDRTVGLFREADALGEALRRVQNPFESLTFLTPPTPMNLGIGDRLAALMPAQLPQPSDVKQPSHSNPSSIALKLLEPKPITPIADHFDGLRKDLGQVVGRLELLVASSESWNRATTSLIGDFGAWREQQSVQSQVGNRIQRYGLLIAVVAFVTTAVCSIWSLVLAHRAERSSRPAQEIQILEEISKELAQSSASRQQPAPPVVKVVSSSGGKTKEVGPSR